MGHAFEKNWTEMQEPYDLSIVDFEESREFIPPTKSQLFFLRNKYPEVDLHMCNNPAEKIDNRIAVRLRLLILTNGSISDELFARLVIPYDNGFYKKSDGKSTPLWWMKVSKLQKWLGVKKDIVAVRHDYDYYRTRPTREKADLHYFHGQIALKEKLIWAKVEYLALKLFGWNARNNHIWKTFITEGYGSDGFIPNLSDKPPR